MIQVYGWGVNLDMLCYGRLQNYVILPDWVTGLKETTASGSAISQLNWVGVAGRKGRDDLDSFLFFLEVYMPVEPKAMRRRIGYKATTYMI